MKKVSVIIPTYKRSDNLIRAIKSVLNQTYKNIEIIVVDDNDEGSTFRKENEKRLKSLVDTNKIIYLKHKKNKNGAAARNTGIKKSSGSYITFLDDDDYFLEDRIEKLVYLLDNNSKYMFAYSSVAIVKNNNVISVVEANKLGNLKIDLLKQKSFFGTGSNMFFRKEAIKKIGFFDEKFIRHQDIEYAVRYFDFGEVIPFNEILVIKSVDDTSNVPDFSKLMATKEQFLKKFDKTINSFSLKITKSIYYDNYLEMLFMFPEKKVELLKILNKYKKLSFSERTKLFLKSALKSSPFLKKTLYLYKKFKYRNITKKIKLKVGNINESN